MVNRMDKQLIRKSDFEGNGFVRLACAPKDIWAWLTKDSVVMAKNGYELETCISLGDIFLDDYIENLDFPTPTELSLLELAHNIIYIPE